MDVGNFRRAIIAMILVVAIVGVVTGYYFLGRSPSGPANASVVTVLIPKGAGEFQGPNFMPTTTTVVIGVNNTVKWIDRDTSSHSVTALSIPVGAAKFEPVIIEPGESYTMKLTVPGIYQYYCLWHPYSLRGMIIVLAQTGNP